MIEAMARGCPCIGSNVGGIPELLEPADLVEPGDPAALASRIKQKLASLPELARTARRNRNVATNYRRECMRPAELAFLRAVRDRAIAAKDGKPVNRSANRADQIQFENPLHLR